MKVFFLMKQKIVLRFLKLFLIKNLNQKIVQTTRTLSMVLHTSCTTKGGTKTSKPQPPPLE